VRIAVIDSSPLINLTHLDLAGKLSLFFDVVLVPRAVQREVRKKSRFGSRLNRLYAMGLFKRCKAADRANVALLHIEKLDEGEAEALTQAQEKQAKEEATLYFIGDEKRARQKCVGLGLRAIGTVRLLARLNRQGDADEPKALVRKLRRDLQFRVSAEVEEKAIAMAEEPI
jgi:predicted nucleic acid-binding protein